MVCNHSVVTFLPIHWANFTVLLKVLESIDHTDTFVDGAAKWHVVNNLVANSASFVDEEEATIRYEFAFDLDFIVVVQSCFTCEDIIVFRDCFVDVSKDAGVSLLRKHRCRNNDVKERRRGTASS